MSLGSKRRNYLISALSLAAVASIGYLVCTAFPLLSQEKNRFDDEVPIPPTRDEIKLENIDDTIDEYEEDIHTLEVKPKPQDHKEAQTQTQTEETKFISEHINTSTLLPEQLESLTDSSSVNPSPSTRDTNEESYIQVNSEENSGSEEPLEVSETGTEEPVEEQASHKGDSKIVDKNENIKPEISEQTPVVFSNPTTSEVQGVKEEASPTNRSIKPTNNYKKQ